MPEARVAGGRGDGFWAEAIIPQICISWFSDLYISELTRHRPRRMGEESEDNLLPSDEEAVISDEASTIQTISGRCREKGAAMRTSGAGLRLKGVSLALCSAIHTSACEDPHSHQALQLRLQQA